MQVARWERIQQEFHQVVDLPVELQRGHLEISCADDPELLRELMAMLEADAGGRSMLDLDLPNAASSLLEENVPLPTEIDFAPYRILGQLGEGGMGIVYLARREDIGNLVAIKLLRGGLFAPERQRRFAIEKNLLAQLEHPRIARIYDADTLADGTPWFAMEYVEGKPITAYCTESSCSIEQRLRLFLAACEAVQYAHRQTIIHRDLKPSNIFVKADGAVKLLDFGIAKQLHDAGDATEHTLTTQHPMTLPYASPEQVRGEKLDTQTDVYSLGVILYQLLTEKLPFDLSHLGRIAAEQIVLDQQPEPPSASASHVRETVGQLGKAAWAELDVLTLTAMHRDPQRRYTSVEALIRDVEHYLKGEPLEARPDSLSYRVGRFVRRNHRILLASAAGATALLALTVFFVVRLAHARDAAVAEATRTQRIERFMLNLFDGGDKTAGPSDDLRVVALLDRGTQNARTLNGEPAVQAELFATLGKIYQALGKLDQADPLLRSALDRRESLTGPDSRDVADSLVTLGLLRLDQGQLPEADRLVRQGLAINVRHLSPLDPDVARGESALGRVLAEGGSYDEAIRTLQDAVRIQSMQSNPTTDLSESLQALAATTYYAGHLADSESLDRRALAMDLQLNGEMHPSVADDYFRLGEVQHDLKHETEAENFYRRSLAIDRSWFGLEHPRTALSMVAVAQSMIYQSRYDTAAPMLQQAIAIQERIFGRIHPQVAMGLNTLGLLEIRRGRLHEAEMDFLGMEHINRAVYGDRHILIGVSMLNLGKIYLEEKQYAHAESEYREALSRFTEKLPPGHVNIGIAQAQLGHVLVLERKYLDAEPHLRDSCDILVKQGEAQSTRLQVARADLVAVSSALKRPEEPRQFHRRPAR